MRSKQYNVEPDAFTQKSYEMPVDTLDNYIEQNNIRQVDVLKIDTQGFEDEVLQGAAKSLDAGLIKVIEAELIVGDLYERSLNFLDLEQILIPRGYKFFALDAPGNLIDNPSLSFNVIYVHRSMMGQGMRA